MIDTLCNALPSDELIGHLTHDLGLLTKMVQKKRRLGLKEYPSIDSVLDYDDDIQFQCEIVEQIIDAGIDSHRLPNHMKSGK